jgi:DNA-binding SARP family transcriptional activator
MTFKQTELTSAGHKQRASAVRVAPRFGRGLIADVYERFPYAIMVVDSRRRLITANCRGREILERRRLASGMTGTCCGLFGCHVRGGPLERCCITELALQTARRLPEIRLDVPAARTGALWVTAAPLDDEGSAVVFQMRPGSPEDRRARTRPQWPDGRTLRIYALGPIRLETPGGVMIGGDWLKQRPGQLLRYLVTERQRIVPTEVIASAVWGQTGRNAPNTVRYFVHALRDRLEPSRTKHSQSSFVVSRRGGYALNGERVWIDVDEFEQEVRRGRVAMAAGDQAFALERFQRAVDLYRDDFLADRPYEEWAFDERERLRALAGDTLSRLSELCEHEPYRSVSYLERLGGMEPFDNDIHRDLIAAMLRLGRRSRAVRHYHGFRQRVMSVFDDPPDFELADVIAMGDPQAGSGAVPPDGLPNACDKCGLTGVSRG